MKKLLFIFCLLTDIAFSQCSCRIVSAPTGTSAVFMGNSVTVGVGASPSTNRYSTLVSAHFSLTEINLGVSGQRADELVKSTIPVYNASLHRFLFFEYGINDLAFGTTPSQYLSYVTANVNYAISTRGWPPSKIVVLSVPGSYTRSVPPNDLYTTAVSYNTNISNLCTSLGMQYVDVSTPFYGNPSWSADFVHPNNTGYLNGMANPIDSTIH